MERVMRGVFTILGVFCCGVAFANPLKPCDEVGLDEVVAFIKPPKESMSYYTLHFSPQMKKDTKQFLESCLKENEGCLVQYEAGKPIFVPISSLDAPLANAPSGKRENLVVAFQYEDAPNKKARCVVMLNQFSVEPSWKTAIWDLDHLDVYAYATQLVRSRHSPIQADDLGAWIKAAKFYKPSPETLLYEDKHDED